MENYKITKELAKRWYNNLEEYQKEALTEDMSKEYDFSYRWHTDWEDADFELLAKIFGKPITQFMSDLEHELKSTVEDWINKTFNFIELEVYEKMCDNMLFEYIRQEVITADDAEEWYLQLNEDEQEEIREESYGELDFDELADEKEDEIREYLEENRSIENYPMWNTLFEFRFNPSEKWIEAAQEVGLGVIEGMDNFDTTLFASSAGHSFYGSYWIPLYLKIFPYEAEKYEGVKYDHL